MVDVGKLRDDLYGHEFHEKSDTNDNDEENWISNGGKYGGIMNQIFTPMYESRLSRMREGSSRFAHQFIGDGGRRKDELFRKWPGGL